MGEPWRVKNTLNRRTLTEQWTVMCAGEYLRMDGKFSTIRRFRTQAGAQRACDKANAERGLPTPKEHPPMPHSRDGGGE